MSIAKALIVCGLCASAGLLSGCQSVKLGWQTTGKEQADVFVNGRLLGHTPLEVSFKTLKRRLNLVPEPEEKLPEDMVVVEMLNSDWRYSLKAGQLGPKPLEGRKTNVILIEETRKGKTKNWLLFVEVVMPDGRIGVPNGGGSGMSDAWCKRKAWQHWYYKLVRPEAVQ